MAVTSRAAAGRCPSARLAVVTADELRSVFAEAGLEAVVWNEQDGALAEISKRSFTPTVDPAQVGPAQLMPDFQQRIGNLGRSIGDRRLGILQAVLLRP